METNRPEEITEEMWDEIFDDHMPHINNLLKDYMSEEDLIDDKIKGLISLFCYEPMDERDGVQMELELHYAQCANDVAIVKIKDFTTPVVTEHRSISINDEGYLQLLGFQKGIPCYAIVTTFPILSRAGEKLKEFDIEFE